MTKCELTREQLTAIFDIAKKIDKWKETMQYLFERVKSPANMTIMAEMCMGINDMKMAFQCASAPLLTMNIEDNAPIFDLILKIVKHFPKKEKRKMLEQLSKSLTNPKGKPPFSLYTSNFFL